MKIQLPIGKCLPSPKHDIRTPEEDEWVENTLRIEELDSEEAKLDAKLKELDMLFAPCGEDILERTSKCRPNSCGRMNAGQHTLTKRRE